MADDGTRDQLWEKNDKQRIIQEIFPGRLPACRVGEKTDLLKSEETDTQWHQHMQQRKVRVEQQIDVFQKKVKIFVVAENSHISGYTQKRKKTWTFSGCEQQVNHVVKQDTRQDNEKVGKVEVRIKPQRHSHQKEFGKTRFSEMIQEKISCKGQG